MPAKTSDSQIEAQLIQLHQRIRGGEQLNGDSPAARELLAEAVLRGLKLEALSTLATYFEAMDAATDAPAAAVRVVALRSKKSEGWTRKGDTISKGMVSLDVGAAERDAIERLRVFVRGRERIESDTGGPAGDMLFKDSAIRVRLVGALLARGAEPKKMLTAFPTLEADDIAFAGMFARLNKGPGSASTGRARAARAAR